MAEALTINEIQQQFQSSKTRLQRAVVDENQEDAREMATVLNSFQTEISTVYQSLVQSRPNTQSS